MNWHELRAAQRAAGAIEGPWAAEGRAVLRGRYELARCDTEETARVIAAVFNAFGPLANAAIMLQRRINDLRKGKI